MKLTNERLLAFRRKNTELRREMQALRNEIARKEERLDELEEILEQVERVAEIYDGTALEVHGWYGRVLISAPWNTGRSALAYRQADSRYWTVTAYDFPRWMPENERWLGHQRWTKAEAVEVAKRWAAHGVLPEMEEEYQGRRA